MLDALPLTIGFVGAAICALVLWHGRRAAHRADDEVDAPTGLPDRRRFDRDVDACSHRATEPCAVLLVAIDVTVATDSVDGDPRAAAADAQAAIAAVVSSLVRGDDVAYRYARDRVAVLMPNTGVTVAGRVAERIRAGVAAIAVSGVSGVAVGVGVAAGPSQRIRHVVDQASAAAASAGRNRVAIA